MNISHIQTLSEQINDPQSYSSLVDRSSIAKLVVEWNELLEED